jgi:hypothetical protein
MGPNHAIMAIQALITRVHRFGEGVVFLFGDGCDHPTFIRGNILTVNNAHAGCSTCSLVETYEGENSVDKSKRE